MICQKVELILGEWILKCIMRRRANIENRLFMSFLKQGGPPSLIPTYPPPFIPMLSSIPSSQPSLPFSHPTFPFSIYPSRRGLNMRRGSNILGLSGHFYKCFKFQPGLNRNRLLAVQRRGSNSFNSASDELC